MTDEQLAAYEAKYHRESAARERLNDRHSEACMWLESNFTSLAHWQRFVEATEALIATLRQEEAALPPFGGSSFLRELVTEDPVLWQDILAMAAEAPSPVDGILVRRYAWIGAVFQLFGRARRAFWAARPCAGRRA